MTEGALTRCPHCKGKVERLISAGTGLIFKGSGFYSTDYKKKPEAGSMKQEGGSKKQEAGDVKQEVKSTKPEVGAKKCPK